MHTIRVRRCHKCYLLFFNDSFSIVCTKVNKNFAIHLVAEEPVADIEARVVSCDGGGGALGHPKVYINLVRANTSAQSLQSCM